MPTLGYICGGTIRQYIEAVSKYVALFLLCIIGINMIRENLKGECKETNGALGFTVMVPTAIATSIRGITGRFFCARMQTEKSSAPGSGTAEGGCFYDK